MSHARVLFSTLPIYQIVQLISRFSNSFDTPQQADNDGANGRLPLESPKKCPDFGKKGPDGVHLWIKFTIQNVFLTVSRRKSPNFFPTASKFHACVILQYPSAGCIEITREGCLYFSISKIFIWTYYSANKQ